MLIPVGVDVPMQRYPFANFAVIGFTLLVFAMMLGEGLTEGAIESMILDGWSLTGLLGHMLLHGGFGHLLGNMLFLWVFGNAICAKVGNFAFLAIYVGLGIVAAITHLILDGGPAIGASGAINGVVGMFLILYPLNDIRIWYWASPIYAGEFTMTSGWVIALWFVFDVWGALGDAPGVAYWAHLGGVTAGVGLAWALLATEVIEMDDTERSLIDVIRGDQ